MTPTFDNTIGALEIGTYFSLFLFGIVTMQVYTYYNQFGDDRLAFKIAVGVIWLLELGHTISVCRELYIATDYSVKTMTEPYPIPIFGVVTIISGFITTIVQIFFSYRVWTALPSPWKAIGAFTALVALSRCGMSTYIGIEATVSSLEVDLSRIKYEYFITALLVTAAVVDVLIAGSMLSFLSSKRERAAKMIKLIDHLMLLTIRTGLITSITAVVVLILYQTMQKNFLFLALFTCLAKLYSNSLLSALNARNSLRDTAAKEYGPQVSPRSSGSQRALICKERPSPFRVTSPPIFIEMTTTTETHRDESIC